jgi:hypothetical protein
MKKLWMMVACAALAGCATSPIPSEKAVNAPSDRVYEYSKPQSDNDSELVIVRDSGFLGSGCRAAVYVDDKLSAMLSKSEKVSLYVPSGEHLLAVSPSGNGICGVGDAKNSLKRTITITAKPRHRSDFRIAVLGDGGLTLMQTTL